MRRLLPALALLLAACEAAPGIDLSGFEGRTPPAPAGYPSLLPREALEAEPPRVVPARADTEARATALRARAAALAGPVVAPSDRLRLQGAGR